MWAMKERNSNNESGGVANLVGHSGPVYGMDYSSDGAYLISCSEDSTGNA
jgi:WD40 repeat protein